MITGDNNSDKEISSATDQAARAFAEILVAILDEQAASRINHDTNNKKLLDNFELRNSTTC
jgi:hypothetical protein